MRAKSKSHMIAGQRVTFNRCKADFNPWL